MGVATYLSFERELPGVGPADVNGKALAANDDRLDKVARKLGMTPLGELWSSSPEEYEALFGGEDEDDESEASDEQPVELPAEISRMMAEMDQLTAAARDAGPPVEQCFDPAVGLATVRALVAEVQARPKSYKRVEALLGDLADVERLLVMAQEHGVRFHFSTDI